MKTLVHNKLGPKSIPHEIRDLRAQTFEYFETMGFPVIHKHRWTIDDYRKGVARLCPLHDPLYNDSPFDDVCFGTGFVGGYGDGQIVYVSIADAPTDIIRVLPQGILSLDQTPQMIAPWLPLMQDGDLIILADFTPGTWEIADLHERYVLEEVSPVTMRGEGFSRSTPAARHRVKQEARINKLPSTHDVYKVPITFNYDAVPDDEIPPDWDKPPVGKYSAFEIGIRVRGKEDHKTATASRDVRVSVHDDTVSTTTDVRVTGKAKGTIINL